MCVTTRTAEVFSDLIHIHGWIVQTSLYVVNPIATTFVF